MSPIELTKGFIAAWERRDVDAIVEAAADDIVYHNIPMEPVVGKEALRAGVEPFLGMCERVVWETPHIAETAEGAVLTERLDHFHFPGGNTLSVRVMGTFEFNAEGKLAKWRDYFDLAEFQSQVPG
ncbi:MAG: limonene-1,2-epoxide hydrolase family protein [Pseudomonadota bacterium]